MSDPQITVTITAYSMDQYADIIGKLNAAMQTAAFKDAPVTEKAEPKAKANGSQKPKEEQKAAPEEQTEKAAETSEQADAGEGEAFNPFAEETKPKKAKKLTRDDVSNAFKKYITTFGQASAMADVTVMLQTGFSVKAIKDIPNDQEAFTKAIEMVNNAIETNQFNRERVN